MIKMTTTMMIFQHDVKDDPIVDSHRRQQHNIMSSITRSRRNYEQGQPKPQLGGGGCTAHHNNETTGAGRGRAPPQAPPHRGGGRGGGYHGVGGGRGGVAALHHIYIYIDRSDINSFKPNTPMPVRLCFTEITLAVA